MFLKNVQFTLPIKSRTSFPSGRATGRRIYCLLCVPLLLSQKLPDEERTKTSAASPRVCAGVLRKYSLCYLAICSARYGTVSGFIDTGAMLWWSFDFSVSKFVFALIYVVVVRANNK